MTSKEGFSVAQECGTAADTFDGMQADAKQSQSGLKLSDRSELQAREDRERKDRDGWFARGDYAIGRSVTPGVATCRDTKDRDLILTMARSYDAMREALEKARQSLLNHGYGTSSPFILRIDAALSLANGSKKEVGE